MPSPSFKTEMRKAIPDFSMESAENMIICGIDEVGRAPLAGPVAAACVYVPPEKRSEPFWSQVRDSKVLSRKKRKFLSDCIRESCNFAIGEASVEEIESLNIYHASLLAMKRAFSRMANSMKTEIHMALIDGNASPSLSCRSTTVIKGDTVSASIAAAAIVAKVHRDMLMCGLHENFSSYGWDRNAGYPTPDHIAAIKIHGITRHHRKTFGTVREQSLL